MRIGVNCGHTESGAGYGSVGLIKESEHTRFVGRSLMKLLRDSGVSVVDCTIEKADSQEKYLAEAVALANRQDLDWFISIHFNASNGQGHGVEVYTYEGRKYQDALDVCKNISELGFANRGVKAGTGLYVIRKTKAKSMLIEVCFCDNEADVSTYLTLGEDKIAQAICDAIIPYMKESEETEIMGKSVATVDQLNKLLMDGNPRTTGYTHLAKIFLEEGEKEGVRGDGAFCQSLIETGYFKFGGDVQPNQHNYAGLGATGGVPGLSFQDDRTGIRAQIQHLKAYASTENLFLDCVDPRYKYVSKGCAPTFERLSGKWAVPGYSGYASLEDARTAKDSYGDHIVQLLNKAIGTETANPIEAAPEGTLYVVQVGAYKNRSGAEALQKRLESMGVVSVIKQYKE